MVTMNPEVECPHVIRTCLLSTQPNAYVGSSSRLGVVEVLRAALILNLDVGPKVSDGVVLPLRLLCSQASYVYPLDLRCIIVQWRSRLGCQRLDL